jgi:phosphohistidine phosphatase
MTRTLLLMRHGKSDWDAEYEGDHERPLAKRGRKAASRMGRFLAEVGETPDRIVSSTAVRARTTAERVMKGGSFKCPLELSEALYGTSAEGVIAAASEVDAADGTLLVVGHDPVWSELVSKLIGGGSVRMPTAAVACVKLELDGWQQLGPACGQLEWHVTPKMLKRAGLG